MPSTIPMVTTFGANALVMNISSMLKGLLRIDGTFSGTIRTRERVLIGKTGSVHSDVYASNVVVGGEVIGNIYATEKVTLLSTCRLKGDIHTPRLIVEEGVIFEGSCKINEKTSGESS